MGELRADPLSDPVDRSGRVVHLVVPDGIDDRARPSGGNVYDRRVCTELTTAGWTVHEHRAPGAWPDPGPRDEACVASLLDQVPAGSLLLVDGLVASAVPDLLTRYADRLRLVVLVHLPLGVASPARRPAEARMLASVRAVVVTSAWTGAWLVAHEGVPADRVVVAVPGTEPAALAPGTQSGGELLCVGAVTPTKGQDVLVAALAEVRDLAWQCTCVGSLEVESSFAEQLRAQVRDAQMEDRLRFTGPQSGDDLDAAYAAADLLVVPSRIETYGMVVAEALARGVPVVATTAGGVREPLGDGARAPGVLVPPDDPLALAAALRAWLGDADHRTRLRAAARARRPTLPLWTDTAGRVAAALEALS